MVLEVGGRVNYFEFRGSGEAVLEILGIARRVKPTWISGFVVATVALFVAVAVGAEGREVPGRQSVL